MPRFKRSSKDEMLQGTLDMLILRTLIPGPAHGHTIAHVIEHTSDEVLQVEQGSLYPALHRMTQSGWLQAEWGASENNRKARFYSITAAGRRQDGEGSARHARRCVCDGREGIDDSFGAYK